MIRPFSPLTAMPSSSSAPSPKPKRNPNPNSNSPNPNSGSLPPCKHSPAATLDLLILLLVLFSCAFLIISSLAHLVRTLSTVLPPLLRPLAASFHDAPLPYLAAIIVLLLIGATVAAAELSGAARPWDWPFWPRRRCGNPRCRGLRKALEFDVQLQTEDALRSPPDAAAASMWKEIDGLPWKGGQQGNNPDYECLRAELRRMAPPNGRAVLLFRSRCGCPVAKLEGWGPKRSRRQKKGCTGPFFVLKLQNLLIFVATHCLVQRLAKGLMYH